MTTQWSVLPLPYLNRLLAGCAVFTLSTYVDQVYEDNRWWIVQYRSMKGGHYDLRWH